MHGNGLGVDQIACHFELFAGDDFDILFHDDCDIKFYLLALILSKWTVIG